MIIEELTEEDQEFMAMAFIAFMDLMKDSEEIDIVIDDTFKIAYKFGFSKILLFHLSGIVKLKKSEG